MYLIKIRKLIQVHIYIYISNQNKKINTDTYCCKLYIKLKN